MAGHATIHLNAQGEPVSAVLPASSSVEMPDVQNANPADDLELLRKAGGGDSRAFDELVNRHAQRLFRLAVSLVGSSTDGEDVLQETFIGAFRGLEKFEGRASVKTWLTRILVMQAARWRRDRRRHREMASLDLVSDGAETEDRPEAAKSVAAKMDVLAALQQVSEEHRQVLVLREFDGMSYEEMAEVLDVPRGTVESRLHRARAEVRKHLPGYQP